MAIVEMKGRTSGTNVNKITPSRPVVGNFLQDYNTGILLDDTTTGAGTRTVGGTSLGGTSFSFFARLCLHFKRDVWSLRHCLIHQMCVFVSFFIIIKFITD